MSARKLNILTHLTSEHMGPSTAIVNMSNSINDHLTINVKRLMNTFCIPITLVHK